MAHMVESMFSVREKPWHGLGEILEDAPTSEIAIQKAGLNWNVVSTPVVVNDQIVSDYVANVRDDNGSLLGIVSNHYKILQNAEAFSFMDNLLDNGDVRYETAGSLRNGKTIWIMAKLNQKVDILGDEIEPYIALTNSHDSSSALKILCTPIRICCNNTLNLAIKGAKRNWTTKHMGNMNDKVKEAQNTLKLANNYFSNLNEEAKRLYNIYVSEGDWREIVTKLIPIPELEISVRTKNNLEQKRYELYECIKAKDIAQFRNTGWGVINAVTDFVGHSTPLRETMTYQESRFERVITGDSLVDKAHELILV